MALIIADRVKDSTATSGTGTVTLSGSAPTGFQTFGNVMNTADQTYYCISLAGNAVWEVGIGTYNSSGPTLSRDVVLASSAGAGTHGSLDGSTYDVFVTIPAYLPSSSQLGQDIAVAMGRALN